MGLMDRAVSPPQLTRDAREATKFVGTKLRILSGFRPETGVPEGFFYGT